VLRGSDGLEEDRVTESTSWLGETSRQDMPGHRRLQDDDLYPEDLFMEKPYKDDPNRYVIFLHAIGIMYMLLGLNTVCDIYFTGALEVMVEQWNIKPDVAGATFMAAGGSAPELFTSLIGATIAHNDVGFSTIVGSAVFNVLFVIGLCGWVANSDIKLTWWPLFRDCSFYICGLALLASLAWDGAIALWEAIVLFIAYIGYLVIMWFNPQLEAIFTRGKSNDNVESIADADEPDKTEKPDPGLASATSPDTEGHEAPATEPPANEDTVVEIQNKEEKCQAWLPNDTDTLKMKAAASPPPETPQVIEFDSEQQSAGKKPDSGERSPPTGVPPKVIELSPDSAPEQTPEEQGKVPAAQGQETSWATKVRDFESGNQEQEPKAETKPEEKDGDAEAKEDEEEDDDEEDDDLMAIPESPKDKFVWFMSLPVYVPIYYTLPKPCERWFLVTFGLSLGWIAGFSFLLVWWVDTIGRVLGISEVIMGFTFLAAGTSIPDAVSSMAVAKAGEGDMAVSSSIGSNIFDILVGLPIPWIIKTGFVEGLGRGRSEYKVCIKSPFLPFYVLLLMLMVLCTIFSINQLGWKLNKCLGAAMAALYLVFLTIALTVEDRRPSALTFGREESGTSCGKAAYQWD
jgi:sodium/potassium/calcium exchanger 2